MDLGVASHSITREFLAVVLAGFGSELSPLTSDHGDEPCPKALLPIANKPMLDYILAWIEKSGVHDVLLICPAIHKKTVHHHIHSASASSSTLRIDLQTFDESQDETIGTCALLRHFSNRIKDDFILLPCDFIPPPSLPLSDLLNKFRTEATADGMVATSCWFSVRKPEKESIPEDWGTQSATTPIVWDEASGTLLHVDTPDDVDRNGEEIEVRMGLLSRYPRTKLSNSLQDAHVYVCRRSVLDALQEKAHFESFKEEFFPWLCKVQHQRTKREKYGQILSHITNTTSQCMALKHSSLSLKSRERMFPADFKGTSSRGTSVPASPTGDEDDEQFTLSSLRVGIQILRPEAGFTDRVNTLASYLEANRHFLAQTTYALPTDQTDRVLIDQKAQISSDCMIGESTKVEERTTIKKSVIGRHCVIGKMSKIVGCIILDHCIVAEGAKLEGCILGKNSRIGIKAELTKCVTQAGYEVLDGTIAKNEKLEVSDWAAGDDLSSSGADDDKSEGSSEESEGSE